MFNKIRLLLLVAVLALGGLAGYYLLTQYKGAGTPLKVKITNNGVDVEIENFSMEHQVLGRKDWELKADFAQVDNARNTTRMKNVQVVLNMENDEKSTISADVGIMNNETQDIELQGHVKFVASVQEFQNRFRATSPQPVTP